MAKETPPRSKVDYDKEQDILFIYGQNKAASSLKYASFVIDTDKNGKVTSLEIFEASKMLKNLGVTEEMLTNAHSARLKSKKDVRGFLYIYFELGFPAGSKLLTVTSGPIAVPAAACA